MGWLIIFICLIQVSNFPVVSSQRLNHLDQSKRKYTNWNINTDQTNWKCSSYGETCAGKALYCTTQCIQYKKKDVCCLWSNESCH